MADLGITRISSGFGDDIAIPTLLTGSSPNGVNNHLIDLRTIRREISTEQQSEERAVVLQHRFFTPALGTPVRLLAGRSWAGMMNFDISS
jgi:hypothetical protein